jgi:sec-independent protein translocase protein TatC
MALVPFAKKALPDPEPDWDERDPELDDGGKMSFLEHLDELRRRIIYALIGVAIGFGIACFFLDEIFNFVAGPIQGLLKPGETLTYIDPTEAFALYLKLAVIVGLLGASPVVMTQVWLFIAPGLYAHEKKFALPFILLSSICFVGGAAFAHEVVFPMTWKFLASWSGENLTFSPRIETAFGLYLKLIIAMALVFQMPPVVLILARMGLVTARFLVRNFKYAVLIIFIAAAILTPDASPVTQTLMAGPMIVLYCISIGLAWLVGRKRRRAEAED